MRKRFRWWRWRRRGIPAWMFQYLEDLRAKGWHGVLMGGSGCYVRTFPCERVNAPHLGERTWTRP